MTPTHTSQQLLRISDTIECLRGTFGERPGASRGLRRCQRLRRTRLRTDLEKLTLPTSLDKLIREVQGRLKSAALSQRDRSLLSQVIEDCFGPLGVVP